MVHVENVPARVAASQEICHSCKGHLDRRNSLSHLCVCSCRKQVSLRRTGTVSGVSIAELLIRTLTRRLLQIRQPLLGLEDVSRLA